jgi:hypothetical protein
VNCYVCGRRFIDGDQIVPILGYVSSEKRGDWITTNPQKAAHAHHLKELKK